MHARSREAGNLVKPHPVDIRPAPLTPSQTYRNLIAALVERNLDSVFEAPLPDDDEIDYDKSDVFATFLKVDAAVGRNPYFPENPLLSAIEIQGDKSLVAGLVSLIERFSHLFSNTLSSTPADIPPFDLKVDLEKWNNPKNRGPPRVQSSANQAEIALQIDLLLSQGIIERSSASYYSQIHLAPKGDGKKRFCIDFKKLNDCTDPASWPVPNIREMFVRLGTHKSSVFGVMDLTSGYHQAPMSFAARIFTAFIAFCGVFHYLRLPFGPKRAPSYFQEMMAAVVLAGLIYFICEIYLDDCIVHASDNLTFISRLELIFKRFEKHKIILKPGKCRFGLSEVEFCGRVISKEGISVSDKKKGQVLDFPLPVYMKQLKSFLGLANYSRPHVPHHSEVARPLHAMLNGYSRGKLLVWTVELKASFHELQRLINECPTMYFVDPDAQVYVHTDASDYGIGGYMFQIFDSVERPCAFVSKSLNETQIRWSTIQKEAYGIFFTCRELNPLLRDRHFILRTDHKNLLFLHENSNAMIQRWFMSLLELDFTLEHLPGKLNEVSDALSRLCLNKMVNLPKEYTPEDIYVSAILPDMVVPADKAALIKSVHNSLCGHHGVERTIMKLTQSHPSWPFLRQHVKKFIKACPLCQKISQIKLQIHASPFSTSSYTPMEILNIDYVGPYPDGGYALVIIDCFSRWIEIFPVDSTTGEATAVALLQHFGRFGAPSQIRSDRGSHFVNSLIREFLLLVGTDHCLTLAYSKEENSLVERANKEVNRHLRAFTFDANSVHSWRLSLPMVQRIMNSTYADRTKLSPSSVLFANVLNLDRGIFVPFKDTVEGLQPLSDYMKNLLAVQENILALAKANIVFADNAHIGNYSAKRTQYSPDSYVLVQYREGSAPTRLHTTWKGPLRVISGSESKYLLLDLITNKEKDYHVTDMKPFFFNPLTIDPIDVARKDYLEFFVEAILDHKGTKKSKKKTLEFYIKWLGYDSEFNTWEPYANIRDTKICHNYLASHDMNIHIPKKFKILA
jgi:transposase InsO family protein